MNVLVAIKRENSAITIITEPRSVVSTSFGLTGAESDCSDDGGLPSPLKHDVVLASYTADLAALRQYEYDRSVDRF